MPRMTWNYNHELVLQAIANAGEEGIDSLDISRAVHMSRSGVQAHIRKLRLEELIDRRKTHSRGPGGWGYLYTCIAKPTIRDEDDPIENALSDARFWADIDEATRRARPNWRIGELARETPPPQPLDGFEQRRVEWQASR